MEFLKTKTPLLTLGLLFLGALTLWGCGPGAGRCGQDSDCPAGQRCAVSTGQCSECVDNADCGDGFCCRGSCKAESEADSFCGCEADPGGAPGQDCSSYSLGDTNMNGAICQSDGEPATAQSVEDASCGCIQSGAADCSTDADGLAGLCQLDPDEGGICVIQDDANCGDIGSACNAATGGNF
jgi:hypothetical protein